MYRSLAIISVYFLLMFTSGLYAQNAHMDQPVNLNYRNVRLGDALQNISTRYDVSFSYSKHYVPVDKRINLKVKQMPLSNALDQLFESTPVVYASIGDQIVLKKGKPVKKEIEFYGSIQPPIRVIERKKEEEVFTASTKPYETVEELPILEKYNYGLPEVLSEQPEEEIDTEQYYVEAPEPDISRTVAQVSLYPTFGTNSGSATEKTNNLSLNILGGQNGGVDGVEVGGLFNQVKNDVNGVQVAGLFNSVGGDVGPSKLIDGNHRKTFGVQIAGLTNQARNVRAIQIGGVLNTCRGSLIGVQVAGLGNSVAGDGIGVQVGGLYNVVRDDIQGIQISGLFNVSGDDSNIQIAGLMNVADDIEGAQVSGLFNRAENVQGVQFGLINVADTVSIAAIGLLSFVKKGYNQFELGLSETMHSQAAFRFGSRRFYNIIQFGIQFDNEIAYGIGYGVGTAVLHDYAVNWQWNVEAVSSQILERQNGFNRLNLLNEFRLSAEYRANNRFSIYFGPTLNVMVSDLINSTTESFTYGSRVPLYTIFDNENSSTQKRDVKLWLGFRAGIRFGRNH